MLGALVFAALSFDVHGADGERAKRVLMVSTGSRFSVGFPILEQSIIDRLRQLYPGTIEFYGEYLDLVRFPSESYQRLFRDYLRDKYTDDPPDLIMLMYVGNLGVAESLLEKLFPETPVVAAGLTEEEIPAKRAGRRLTGLAERSDPGGTIALIRRLQPDIRRVLLVGGIADVDRQVMSRARQAVLSLDEPLEVEVWDTRSLAEILGAVTSLPPQTAILFTRMFRDGAGRATISANVAQSVAKVSNAPVYVMSDPMLGTGAVGGSVADVPSLGGRAAELAHRVLSGAEPQTLPLEIITQGTPIFDWRALRRWGISESRLPPGSIVRNRPQSVWEQYRWYIIGALLIMALQAAIIADLLLHRARRRRAESELRESREFMELATEAGQMGMWVRDMVRNDLWVNPRLRSLFGFGQDDVVRIKDIEARLHSEDRGQIVTAIERAQKTGVSFDVEFRTAVSLIPQRWLAARGRMIRDSHGRPLRTMGTVIDITERKQSEERLRQSEENFRRLVETTSAVLWQADVESWAFTYVAPQAVKLLGYPLERWYEKDFWTSHIHPLDRDRAVGFCLTMSQTVEEFEFEYRMIASSGETVWVHDIVSCQQRDGQAAQLRGLMLDVTERKEVEEMLWATREQLQIVTESMAAPVAHCSRDFRYLWVSRPYARWLGRSPEEIIGRRIVEIIGPEAFDALRPFFEKVLTGEQVSYEERVNFRGLGPRWVNAVYSPTFDAAKTPDGWVGVVIDIEERKRSEQALRESEERFRTMANTAPVMIWMSGTDKLCNFFSKGWLDFTGRTLEQELGNGWPERIHPEDFERCLEVYENSFNERREFSMEYRLARHDGEFCWVFDKGVPRFAQDGTFLGYIGTAIDVSEVKRGEAALDKERAFLRQVIDIDPNFIFAKDRQGRFTLVNQAVADAYGTTVESLIGRSDADFNQHPDEVEFFQRTDLEVMDTLHERFVPEEHITDAQGKVRWLQTVKRPIIDRDGSANQVLGASTDITWRKEAEDELRQQRDELAHVTRLSTMGELAASLAHELNQPLTAILSNVQAAQRFLAAVPPDLEEIREILGDVVQDNNRASEVIRRLRALVKKEELALLPLDLITVIRDVVVLVHSDAIFHNVMVAQEADPHLPNVRGDKVQLQQVVLNLLLNAFDAMADCPAEQRRVTVRVGRDGPGMVKVTVSDRGIGLSRDNPDKLFEPFYTTKRDGLGMGLSISRSIIEAHAGRLWAENNRDRGATFYFTVPMAGKSAV